MTVKTRSYVDMPEYPEAWELVSAHFKDDKKSRLWFTVSNPMLGNVAPADMLATGRGSRLLKIIKDMLAGNHA